MTAGIPEGFIESIRDGLADGETLQEVDGYIGGFSCLELVYIRDGLEGVLTDQEKEWIDDRLQDELLVEINSTAGAVAEKRAAYEAVDAAQLELCAAAVALGYEYTLVARQIGSSRQVLTKRLQRHEGRLACQAA